MREVLLSVLDIQRARADSPPRDINTYNHEPTRRRRSLVTDVLTGRLRRRLPVLRANSVDDLDVSAKDGQGRPAEVPWARVHSRSRSPRARDGWYAVYLFDAVGQSVYLALMQGTTTGDSDAPVDRADEDLVARSSWARQALGDDLAARSDLLFAVDLKGRSGKRAKGYQLGTVAAFEYRRDAVPGDDVLDADLLFLTAVLARLHEIEESPEVAEAVESASRTAGRAHGGGQGFGLDRAGRVAVEGRAVRLAREHLEAEGWTVRDVGAVESYDLAAVRGDERLFVEVKGTTSAGTQVVLTRNEVLLNAERHPDTMLIVVSGIVLGNGRAHGGRLRVVHPWRVEEDLSPISYRYRVR
ncbi:MrcB family domain-containing protein [Saccharothrix longispora]|uniref:Protein NO VEIN C-terminal domain-containing protein n=1 Tax=Saccharothrix longispora TaxID=33920 RepID=A0ABU1PT79_9PSEU|nr:DUF3578 domain-containing protein [Saccharothrix longispora]MDR6593857.1 hypothetical protein [Saccharothrix longispora]